MIRHYLSVLFPVRDLDPEHAKLTVGAFNSLLVALKGINAEVVVVDDSSPCRIAIESARSSANDVRLIVVPNDRGPGLVSSLNIAAANASGALLTYCHSDCFTQPNTFISILRTMQDDSAGLVTSELWFQDGTLQQAGGWISSRFRLCWDKRLSHVPQATHWGDFWTVRRGLFEILGGLVESYDPGYWECVDLATSIRASGYCVLTSPGSRVLHAKSRTFHSALSPAERLRIFERNRTTFAQRWANAQDWISEGGPPSSEGEWR